MPDPPYSRSRWPTARAATSSSSSSEVRRATEISRSRRASCDPGPRSVPSSDSARTMVLLDLGATSSWSARRVTAAGPQCGPAASQAKRPRRSASGAVVTTSPTATASPSGGSNPGVAGVKPHDRDRSQDARTREGRRERGVRRGRMSLDPTPTRGWRCVALRSRERAARRDEQWAQISEEVFGRRRPRHG
jgi:hypothetical protein